MNYQPPYTVSSEIIDLIAEVSELLGEIKHLNHASHSTRLRKISKIKTITGTLQIEGNTLNEEQITALLDGKHVLGSVRELAEVRGAITAYENITAVDYKNLEHLLEAHRLLMSEILIHAGEFRTKSVGVYGAQGVTHVAPPANRVRGLMMDLFAWLNSTTEHPLIVSSVFHYEFEFIHPFIDGNGRMGRLWQYIMLHHWRDTFSLVPVESMIRNHQQGYYQALQQAGVLGDSTVFLVFMLKTIRQSILDVKQYNDQVGDQASDQVQRLLSVIPETWASAAELMQLLELSHKPTFRKNYLLPALEQKHIEMSHADSPRSPKQKYRKIIKPWN